MNALEDIPSNQFGRSRGNITRPAVLTSLPAPGEHHPPILPEPWLVLTDWGSLSQPTWAQD